MGGSQITKGKRPPLQQQQDVVSSAPNAAEVSYFLFAFFCAKAASSSRLLPSRKEGLFLRFICQSVSFFPRPLSFFLSQPTFSTCAFWVVSLPFSKFFSFPCGKRCLLTICSLSRCCRYVFLSARRETRSFCSLLFFAARWRGKREIESSCVFRSPVVSGLCERWIWRRKRNYFFTKIDFLLFYYVLVQNSDSIFFK